MRVDGAMVGAGEGTVNNSSYRRGLWEEEAGAQAEGREESSGEAYLRLRGLVGRRKFGSGRESCFYVHIAVSCWHLFSRPSLLHPDRFHHRSIGC